MYPVSQLVGPAWAHLIFTRPLEKKMFRRKIELWEDIQRNWLAIIECLRHGMSEMKRHELAKALYISDLRCFDTVFQRPYRYFSIALKMVFSLSDCYKIFTSNWLWIEICENVVLSKIGITMTRINEKNEIDKSRILCDLDQLLKIQH